MLKPDDFGYDRDKGDFIQHRRGKQKFCSWLPLQEGDLVDVVAPARACSRSELQGAKNFLESWGLKARIPANIFSQHYLCSNTDQYRPCN